MGLACAWANMEFSTVSSSHKAVYSDGIIFIERSPDESRIRSVFRMLELIGYLDKQRH